MAEQKWTADRIPDQTGRTFVVTGASSGLGLATAREVARRGAHVILAVRDLDKGRRVAAGITRAHPAASLQVCRLDLADLDSVHAFAEDLSAREVGVDVLVNNAGVMMPPRSLSPQGHELQFASNHLGHFALTGLLLHRLTGADPRVVTVTSTAHRAGRIHFDDLTGVERYSPVAYYAQSKFANVLFGLELDRRLRAAGSPVRSVLAHPGYAATNLQTTGPTGVAKQVMRVTNRLLAQSVEMGALPQLYAACAPEAAGGQLVAPGRMWQQRGHPAVARPVASAEDPATARRLWQLSEELTGVSYDLPAAA